jgi:flap endonuclease GEN
MGPTQFIRTSLEQVAAILEAMGLPVIQAPGEAEATCAALCSAGIVDGVASFDGDTLLFGAETVYLVVKLSTTQEKTCTLTKLSLEQVRTHLV